MVSLTSILATVTLAATSVDFVKAHGYIKEPLCSFVGGKVTSKWITQIEPLWKGPWETCNNYKDLLAMFKKLALANNYKDLRTLMDGNPAFGNKCGFTNPNATPVAAPTNGKATFSRRMVHAGPCAIYLDNRLVFHSDDCQSSNGDGIFKVDYSSCASSGCMLRFYWLALQRRGGKTLWQSYKNCIPLKGPPGGKSLSKKNTGHKPKATSAKYSPAMTPAPSSKYEDDRRRRY